MKKVNRHSHMSRRLIRKQGVLQRRVLYIYHSELAKTNASVTSSIEKLRVPKEKEGQDG